LGKEGRGVRRESYPLDLFKKILKLKKKIVVMVLWEMWVREERRLKRRCWGGEIM
jgi:hypothetical protein